MPVFSYLAYPLKGAKEALRTALSVIDHCTVVPAENEELLVLVTDTPDDQTEKQLQQNLKKITSLQSLSMTFGHGDDETKEGI